MKTQRKGSSEGGKLSKLCHKQQSFGDWQAKTGNLPAFDVIEQLLHPSVHCGHPPDVLFPLEIPREATKRVDLCTAEMCE